MMDDDTAVEVRVSSCLCFFNCQEVIAANRRALMVVEAKGAMLQ
jgi:hypothetical protein